MMNMQAGIPKAQLMAGDAMNRALTRMAHEMMEQLMPLENVVLVGIRRRGVPLAQRLSDIIEKYEHVRIPVGEVDIAMYRDDRDPAQLNVEVQEKHLPVDVTGKVVVLVDDVLHTGRTVRAAMDAILDQGRAARICLAVLLTAVIASCPSARTSSARTSRPRTTSRSAFKWKKSTAATALPSTTDG